MDVIVWKNGIETCKGLRENGYEQQILLFSSNDDWNLRLLAYEVGGNDFIQKGTEQDLLEIKVKLAEQAEANKEDLQHRPLFSQDTAHSAIASLGESGSRSESVEARLARQWPLLGIKQSGI